MSYSPTVYAASTVTPSALSFFNSSFAIEAGAAASTAPLWRMAFLAAQGFGSKYSASRGALYASMRSNSLRSPMWIWPRSSTCGTGTTSANSVSAPR